MPQLPGATDQFIGSPQVPSHVVAGGEASQMPIRIDRDGYTGSMPNRSLPDGESP
jgi:hypothetical protein